MDDIIQSQPIPDMEYHHFITVAELVRFANERGVQVVSSANSASRSTISRHDLAKLPKGSSLFLGLAAEIRNLIYEELLCFKHGQMTCFPAILATNKQVYQEAYGILYGKNPFQVQLSFGGVLVQGRTTGHYQESRFGSRMAHTRSVVTRDIGQIKWPVFLRRVESLKFSITDAHVAHFIDVRKVSTENVLSSLCQFLADDHKLKTFSIDVRRRTWNGTIVAESADLHTLLLLDPLPVLAVEGNGGDVDHLTIDTEVNMSKGAELLPRECDKFHKACSDFLQTLRFRANTRNEQLLQAFVHTANQVREVQMVSTLKRNRGYMTANQWHGYFGNFVDGVRAAMEQFDIPLHGPIIKALDGLLHFDIDYKVAKRIAEKRGRERKKQ